MTNPTPNPPEDTPLDAEPLIGRAVGPETRPGGDTLGPSDARQPGGWLIGGYSVAIATVLGVAMLVPTGVIKLFPPPPPKSAVELIVDRALVLGVDFDPEAYIRGQGIFSTSCVACHTADGGAKPNLGKDMVHSDFTAQSTDEQLVRFLKVGRDPGDPLNTTGVGMPPKGGNPALMEDDLVDLVSYIRGLQVSEHVAFTQ